MSDRTSGYSRTNRKLKQILFPACLFVLVVMAAACGDSSPPSAIEASPQPTVTPAAIETEPPPVEVPLDQNLHFSHLTTEDGLSEGRVWDIMQDSSGFMWFATFEGLNRYDGYSFTVYKQERNNPNSPGGVAFLPIHEDRHGMIWAGSHNGGGLSRFNPITEQWTRFQHNPDDPQSLSSNNVFSILEDSNGVLWIGTAGVGLNRFDGETEDGQAHFTRYQHDPDDSQSLGSGFPTSIYEDGAGSLWISSSESGLSRFDPQTESFTHFQNDPENPDSLSYDFIWSVYQDQSGTIWVGTYGGGLNHFNPETETFTRYQHDPEDPHSLSGNTVVDIQEDQAGALWIATFDGGLNRYNPESDNFTAYQHDSLDPRSLNSNSLASLFTDRTGILWVGTAGSGLNKLDPRQQGFALIQHDPDNDNSLSGNDVRSVLVDQSGDLWIGTFDGLNHFDTETDSFTHYQHDPSDPTSLSDNHIHTLTEDRSGILWIGTDTHGLDRFDLATETFSHFEPDPTDPFSLSENLVITLYEDSTGTLWIGTYSEGLNAFNSQSKDGQAHFKHYRHDPEDPGSMGAGTIREILEDQAGVLWIGTTGGGLCRFDRDMETFACYKNDPEDDNSISDNTVFAIHEDRDGILWIGTGSGLNRFDSQTGEFTPYTVADGLSHDTVYGILEAEDRQLWISTLRGLSHFDPVSLTFHNYTAIDGLPGDSFNRHSYTKAETGELFFGSPNGLTVFYPGDIQDNPHIPPVVITSLQLADEPIGVGGDSPLETSLLDAEELIFPYDERIISLEFAALSFNAPEKNLYRFKLEGFDDDWREVDSTRRFATYTNLDPGEYVFRVIGSNNDGIWNEEGAAIAITMTPPWWETTWFRIGLVMLAIGLLIAGYRWRVGAVEARSRDLEVQVRERTQELQLSNEAADKARASAENANEAKSTFLANMSHELRTPLNAILGFTRLLARDPEATDRQEEMLDIVNRSGEHLLSMVDEILSLSKIEAGHIELKQEDFDLVQMLEDIGLMVRVAGRRQRSAV